MDIRRSLSLPVTCAILASGCYLSNSIDGSSSGTRLRAIILEPESGEPMFSGWHDTELDAQCWFYPTSPDGRSRCLPIRPLLSLNTTYLDADCTQQVFEATEGCASPEYVLGVSPPIMCATPEEERGVEILRVGEPVAAARVFDRGFGEPCQARDAPAGVLHRLTPADSSAFVAADLVEGAGDRLARDRLVAEDGATQPTGVLRDTARGERCRPVGRAFTQGSGIEPERLPCVPDEAALTLSGGASCGETWAIYIGSPACGGELPDLAYTGPSGACGSRSELEVFRVGERVPDDDRVFGPGCYLGFDTDPFTVEPAPDAVPWLTRELRGAGRIQRAVWALDGVDGESVVYDSELGVACSPTTTAGGELRCLPRALSLPSGLFVDDGCTLPGVAVNVCPDRGRWYRASTDTTPACPFDGSAVEAIYRAGEPAARAYRIDDSGACVASDDEALELELVPLTSFVRMERRIE